MYRHSHGLSTAVYPVTHQSEELRDILLPLCTFQEMMAVYSTAHLGGAEAVQEGVAPHEQGLSVQAHAQHGPAAEGVAPLAQGQGVHAPPVEGLRQGLPLPYALLALPEGGCYGCDRQVWPPGMLSAPVLLQHQPQSRVRQPSGHVTCAMAGMPSTNVLVCTALQLTAYFSSARLQRCSACSQHARGSRQGYTRPARHMCTGPADIARHMSTVHWMMYTHALLQLSLT